MFKTWIICSLALVYVGLFATTFGEQKAEELVVTQTPADNGNDLGSLKEPLNELILGCGYYLPMVESYIKAESSNPEFLIGGTDIITLQVALDASFSACETILDVIAAYQLVTNDYTS